MSVSAFLGGVVVVSLVITIIMFKLGKEDERVGFFGTWLMVAAALLVVARIVVEYF